jgi:large subunit ribosomal protein L7A
MSYEKVCQATKIVIGTKQTVKALKDGTASELIIASDAEAKVTAAVVNLAQVVNIPIIYVDSMKKTRESMWNRSWCFNCSNYQLKTVFVDRWSAKTLFLHKNEPPGCVGLQIMKGGNYSCQLLIN